jgi:hypothetical protein
MICWAASRIGGSAPENFPGTQPAPRRSVLGWEQRVESAHAHAAQHPGSGGGQSATEGDCGLQCKMLWVSRSVLRLGLGFTTHRAPQIISRWPRWGPRVACHPCSSSGQNPSGFEPPGQSRAGLGGRGLRRISVLDAMCFLICLLLPL